MVAELVRCLGELLRIDGTCAQYALLTEGKAMRGYVRSKYKSGGWVDAVNQSSILERSIGCLDVLFCQVRGMAVYECNTHRS